MLIRASSFITRMVKRSIFVCHKKKWRTKSTIENLTHSLQGEIFLLFVAVKSLKILKTPKILNEILWDSPVLVSARHFFPQLWVFYLWFNWWDWWLKEQNTGTKWADDINTTQELISAEQDSPEAAGRRLSKHFTTDCRDLVLKATAALRAATKLGISCPDGQIPSVESLVSSDAVTNEENSSQQQVWAVL